MLGLAGRILKEVQVVLGVDEKRRLLVMSWHWDWDVAESGARSRR